MKAILMGTAHLIKALFYSCPASSGVVFSKCTPR